MIREFFLYCFFLGLLVACYQRSDQQYIFSPNVVAYKKPTLLDMIRNEEELASVKKSHIIDAENAIIGSAIRFSDKKYFLIKKADLLYTYDYQDVEDKKQSFHVFEFVPDAIGYRHPIQMEKIKTLEQLRKIKHNKKIWNSENASLGACVSRSRDGQYYNLITAQMIKLEYEKLEDL